MAFSRRAQLRRRSREIALQLIYILDMRPDFSEDEALNILSDAEAVTLFQKELADEGADAPDPKKFPEIVKFDLKLSEAEHDEVVNYAASLFNGVRENEGKIDDIIRENMESRWRPDRLVAIDRAILALALYEGLLAKSVPVSVAISEAVEIAKTFGTEESGRFVNGVLGRIARKENDDQ